LYYLNRIRKLELFWTEVRAFSLVLSNVKSLFVQKYLCVCVCKVPPFPLYISGQDVEEGFWVWIDFCATNSLSEGKRACSKEVCVSVNLFFSVWGLHRQQGAYFIG